MNGTAAVIKYCNKCGNPEHGTAACTFEHWDNWPDNTIHLPPDSMIDEISRLNEQIADLRAQLAEAKQWKDICIAQGMKLKGLKAKSTKDWFNDLLEEYQTDPDFKKEGLFFELYEQIAKLEAENAELRKQIGGKG